MEDQSSQPPEDNSSTVAHPPESDVSADREEADESQVDSPAPAQDDILDPSVPGPDLHSAADTDASHPDGDVDGSPHPDDLEFSLEPASNEEEPSSTSTPASRTASSTRVGEKPPSRPLSSVRSLLIDTPDAPGDGKPPPVRSSVVIKRPKAVLDAMAQGSPRSIGAPAQKVIAPAVEVRRREPPKLPEWQASLAKTFLLTPDMSYADDEQDILNLTNRPPVSDADQITEETTRCICNSTHESEVMIQCDSCNKWLHMDCVRLQNSRESDPFICPYCQEELAKAVRGFVRKQLSAYRPLLQRLRQESQGRHGPRPSTIWTEMLEIVRESQEVLKMIPLFLPKSDEGRAVSELAGSVFG
jgi:hypothetical protein